MSDDDGAGAGEDLDPEQHEACDAREDPSTLWSDAAPAWEQPVDRTYQDRTSRRGGRLLGLAAVLLAAVLVAGAAGYAIGNRGASPHAAVQIPRNQFGDDAPFGHRGSFEFPAQGGRLPGSSTSVTVPTAVSTSEVALVDVNTTLSGGRATGEGTGIVLTSSGLVLTNNHVIDGASSISVTDVGNGRTYTAVVVGYDIRGDVAVLKLNGASSLSTASIASSSRVDETVFAVGNAGGSGGTPTVTSGKITATGQSLTASDPFAGTSEALHGMLKTSAALISGDSGGALTASNGSVVGMDTASSSSPLASASGFAIPISTAVAIAHEIIAGAASSTIHVGPTALLGVEINPAQQSSHGALVTSVASGSPAAGAGIVPGSRITNVGGRTVTSGASLPLIMASLHAGATTTVMWVDASGKHRSASLTLATGAPQ